MKKIAQPLTRNISEFKILLGILLFATLTRVALPPFIHHLPSFSAIDAMTLFCGAYFRRNFIALVAVLLSVWIGDIFLNKILMHHWVLFYPGFYWQYGCYVLITLLGITLKGQVKPLRLVTTCFLSALLFFAISNFGVWCSGLIYPFTMNGLMACYVAAIPFFKNTLFSDLLFSILLFGSFELIQIRFPTLILNKILTEQKPLGL